MKVHNLSNLLGLKVTNQNKKEALEITNNLLLKVIQLFKNHSFGIITFYGINHKNLKEHQKQLESAENLLRIKGLNFIKIFVQWNIKFKDVLNFREIGYFILNPTFSDMTELTKKFDQSLFVYSQEKNTDVYYANGTKINLEKDTYEFGEFVSSAMILNFVDFKLFIDSIVDFDFHFLKREEIKIDDKVVILSKNKFTFDTHLEIIDVHDIRQNGILFFERSKSTPAISPKVFHFDEIIWICKLNREKIDSHSKVYKKVI